MKQKNKLKNLYFKNILILISVATTFSVSVHAANKLYSKQIVKYGEIHIALSPEQERALTKFYNDALSLTHKSMADINLKEAAIITPVCLFGGAAMGAACTAIPVFGAVHKYLKSPAMSGIAATCVAPVGAIVGAIGGTAYGAFTTASVPYYKLKGWRQLVNARKTLEENLEKACKSNHYKTIGKASRALLSKDNPVKALPEMYLKNTDSFDFYKVFFKGERITSRHPLAEELRGHVRYFPQISCVAEAKDRKIIDVIEKLAEAGVYEYPIPGEYGPENKLFAVNTPLTKTLKNMLGSRQDQYKNIRDLLVDLTHSNNPNHSRTQYLRDLATQTKYKRKRDSNAEEEEEKQREQSKQEMEEELQR